jgi:hypothetical protein
MGVSGGDESRRTDHLIIIFSKKLDEIYPTLLGIFKQCNRHESHESKYLPCCSWHNNLCRDCISKYMSSYFRHHLVVCAPVNSEISRAISLSKLTTTNCYESYISRVTIWVRSRVKLLSLRLRRTRMILVSLPILRCDWSAIGLGGWE